MKHRYIAPLVLGVATLAALIKLIGAIQCRAWDAATTFATLFAGFVAADVVVWQGYLIKRQLAFSTYLELDNEWNSKPMIQLRQTVHAPGSEEWDHSLLEGILEFFEKLASMFALSDEMSFIYQSTLGWYAAHYFLFAREHGQIQALRELWKEELYADLERFYRFYVRKEAGWRRRSRRAWEQIRLATETSFGSRSARTENGTD